MLYPTAGSRLYIADAPAEMPGAVPAGGWVEIAEVEAIGLIGGEWDLIDASFMGVGDNDGQDWSLKGIERRAEVPIIMGNMPDDAGQLLMWRAFRGRDSYPFRLVFPDGGTAREWFALVFRIGEVFDAANSVIRLQADLKPLGRIHRSDGA